MAMAQHVTIHYSDKKKHDQTWEILQSSTLTVKRLWWHMYGYTAILSIMLLIFSSLVFLVLHWFWRMLQQSLLPYYKNRHNI